jgi:hypothetical protein
LKVTKIAREEEQVRGLREEGQEEHRERVEDLSGILCLPGDGHGGVHSTFLPWQGTEKEEKQRRESKYQLSFLKVKPSIRCESFNVS